MPSLPTLNLPGDPSRVLDPTETFYVVMSLLVIVYLGLHALMASHFGRVVIAIRENEIRCELLGYDVRLHKLLIFTVGGGTAGLAGCLFANWGAFVSPTVFSLAMTSQIIIWVIVGGLGTLLGPHHRVPDRAVPHDDVRHPTTCEHQSDLRDHLSGLRAPRAARPRANAGKVGRPGVRQVADPQPRMNGAVLETVDLSVRFGGVEAVRSVNFTLAERELRCLIGPNGAGKSTLFKLLTGQLRPTAGRILFRGHDITGDHTHAIARRGIGIKSQVPSLFDGLTVREHLWLSARRTNPAARTREIVDEILERMRLTSLASEVVGQFSHGLRQWVELGTVLAGNPTLILLDEPAAGMTHDEVARTAELVRDINRTHALIVVEHDMQFVKMIARTVTVMHQGGVLVEETPWIGSS